MSHSVPDEDGGPRGGTDLGQKLVVLERGPLMRA